MSQREIALKAKLATGKTDSAIIKDVLISNCK
jgi:hypothetical protein